MKKLISLSLIVLLMIFLGVTSVAEARTGKTSSKSGSSSSSSTRSSSSPSKRTSSATSSLFSTIGKTKEAKSAWQERNKKPVEIAAPVVTAPTPRDNTAYSQRQEQQLNDIKKQLDSTKRQQQAIAVGQAALQLMTTNKRSAPPPVISTPVNSAVKSPVSSNTSSGVPWLAIFLVVGGIVLVIFWLKKRNASDTIYRL